MKRQLQVIITASAVSVFACSALAQDTNKLKTERPNYSRHETSKEQRADRLNGAAKASELIGMEVKNYQDEKVGTLDDFAVDLESGRIVQVILSTGGILGIGNTLSAVPPGALHHDTYEKVLHLNADKAKLQKAPKFDANKWSESSSSNNLAAIYRHYDQEPAFNFIGQGENTLGSQRNPFNQTNQRDQTDQREQNQRNQNLLNDQRDERDERDQSDRSDLSDKSDQRNQFGRTDSRNQRDQSDRSEQRNQFGQTDERNQRDQADQRNQFGRIDSRNQRDQSDRSDQRNQIGQSDQRNQRDQANQRNQFGQASDPHNVLRNNDQTWDQSRSNNARQAMIPSERLGKAKRASEIIGMTVKNRQDETLGEVENLLFDLTSGRLVAVVVSSGGFLGMGDVLSAVPPTALQFSSDRDSLQLDVTKEKLSNAPHFKSDQWPDFAQPAQVDGVYRAYQVEPYFNTDDSRFTTDESRFNTDELKDADNTARNERDRDDQTLTPFDQGNSRADIQTTASIRRAIGDADKMSTNAKNVKIITKDGKVTLRGPVNSAEEKRIIGEIANRIARAANVNNQLEVKISTSGLK